MSAHTRSRNFVYNGVKAVAINALPEDAWTPLAGEPIPTQIQKYADAVAYLYRAIEVRANALCAVPWKLSPIGDDAEPIWTSEDEDAPDSLAWAADLPRLLWRTSVAWSFYNEAFWLIEQNRVRILNLKWLDPASVEPQWDENAGLTGFERSLPTRKLPLRVEDVAYLWKTGLRETTPLTPPAQAAMQAAGVLYHADAFASSFFERGAIKATFLTIEGNPPTEDIKKLESWAKKFVSGVKNAWSMPGIRADVKAVPIGEGLESLTNATLTAEKREDIATALGVPHSLIMSNAANYATSSQDARNFYDLTVVPDCLLLQRQLNQQLFTPLGLRFTFDPQEMAVYQEDETKRSQAFATYVGAGIPLSVAAEMLGLYLPEGMEYDDLEPEEPETPATATVGEEEGQGGQEGDGRQEVSMAAGNLARDEEVKRLQRWLKKRPHADLSKFDSDLLSMGEKVIIAAAWHGQQPIVMSNAQVDTFVSGLKVEALPSETGAPFPVPDWENYP